jgi:fructuronate reductase
VARDINILTGVLVAPEDPQAVLSAMADPAVKIVSLTVTEKGYCHNPATGELNPDDPEILHDLTNPMPRTAPGFLVRALDARRKAGVAPFTVLSCDNLPDNGRLVRGVVLALAKHVDPALADWIETQGCFPSTMVDRITPATTAEDVARVKTLTGKVDAAPVLHEPFSQWVVEDNFVGGERPDLEAAGVELVSDVSAHEHMKLRMLNGTHSALAYTGYLAGHETIADTVADPVFTAYTRRLWEEIMPAVNAPDGVDLSTYAQDLLQRYENPKIRHRTWQIAMDGSQKLPQRILGTLETALDDGRNTECLAIAIAAWMRYVGGSDDHGNAIDVRDPLSDRLHTLSVNNENLEQRVETLLSVTEVFPPALAPRLRAPVTDAARQIWSIGTRAAIEEVLR